MYHSALLSTPRGMLICCSYRRPNLFNCSCNAHAPHLGGTWYGFAHSLTCKENVPFKCPMPEKHHCMCCAVLLLFLCLPQYQFLFLAYVKFYCEHCCLIIALACLLDFSTPFSTSLFQQQSAVASACLLKVVSVSTFSVVLSECQTSARLVHHTALSASLHGLVFYIFVLFVLSQLFSVSLAYQILYFL